MKDGVIAAIKAAGGQTKLGDALGVTQQAVSLWLKNGYVASGYVVAIESTYGIPRARLIDPRLSDLIEPAADSGAGA